MLIHTFIHAFSVLNNCYLPVPLITKSQLLKSPALIVDFMLSVLSIFVLCILKLCSYVIYLWDCWVFLTNTSLCHDVCISLFVTGTFLALKSSSSHSSFLLASVSLVTTACLFSYYIYKFMYNLLIIP